MYESHFQLQGHPFSAAPDSRFVYSSQNFSQALSQLESSLRRGVGIGLLTAAPGTGKTMLCKTLAERLADDPLPVLLLNASMPTRSSLLQAILFELDRPYRHMSEQELRLELVTHARELTEHRSGIGLIVDEAHLLGEHILEELRSLTNFLHRGRPMFRIVLSGQPALEDVLIRRSLEAINHKLETHVYLDHLSRQESIEYLLTRVKLGGRDLLELFEEPALEMVVYAADGLPRGLNQLCDLACQLAYQDRSSRVLEKHVRNALVHLQKLPLQWNLPPESSSTPAVESAIIDTPEITEAEQPTSTVIEFADSTIDDQSDIEINLESAHQDEATQGSSIFEVGADMTPMTEIGSLDAETETSVVETASTENLENSADATQTNILEEDLDDAEQLELELSMLEYELMDVTAESTTNTAESPSGIDESESEDSLLDEGLEAEIAICDQEPVLEVSTVEPTLEAEQESETAVTEEQFVEDSTTEAESFPIEINNSPSLSEEIVDDPYARLDALRLGQLLDAHSEISTSIPDYPASLTQNERKLEQAVLEMCTDLSADLAYHDQDYVPKPEEIFSQPVDSLTAQHDVVKPDYLAE